MSFNIQNMIAAVQKTGIAKTGHFEVQITGPGDTNVEREMMYRAEEVEIPGRSLSTIENRFTGIGPVNKVPYDSVYGDLSIGFMLSEDMREKEYFEEWQDRMVRTGAFEDSQGPRALSKYGVRYFDNYAGTVIIRQYGSAGDLRSIHTMLECYPTVIGGVPMNWANDEIAKLNVEFSYKQYKAKFHKQDQPDLGFGFSFKLDKNGLSGSLRDPNIGDIAANGAGALSANIGGITNRFATIRK